MSEEMQSRRRGRQADFEKKEPFEDVLISVGEKLQMRIGTNTDFKEIGIKDLQKFVFVPLEKTYFKKVGYNDENLNGFSSHYMNRNDEITAKVKRDNQPLAKCKGQVDSDEMKAFLKEYKFKTGTNLYCLAFPANGKGEAKKVRLAFSPGASVGLIEFEEKAGDIFDEQSGFIFSKFDTVKVNEKVSFQKPVLEAVTISGEQSEQAFNQYRHFYSWWNDSAPGKVNMPTIHGAGQVENESRQFDDDLPF